MKRAKDKLVLLILLGFSFLAMAQEQKPLWIDPDIRNMLFPSEKFYSGYAVITLSDKETFEEAENRAKQKALGELSDRVRITINSKKISEIIGIGGTNIEEQIFSKYNAVIQTESQTEIIGSKVETYYAKKNREVHTFVHVNKNELADYYVAFISLNIKQLETVLQVASQLESDNEKNKARKHYQEAIETLAKVEYAQEMLITINPYINPRILQKEESATFRQNIIQSLTRLVHTIYIFVKSVESNFDKPTTILASQVKSVLAMFWSTQV